MWIVLISTSRRLKKWLLTSKTKSINPKRVINKYKTLTIFLKSFDKFVITATTPSSITLSLTGFGLTVIPISRSVACGLTISNKV